MPTDPTPWQRIGDTVAAEFADLHDLEDLTRAVLRLAMAAVLSGLVGWERERQDAAAGLRTHMLVGVGAALFVLVPQQAGASLDALSRVIQGLLAGIGFLGAGAIIRLDRHAQVKGLTTAASIWAVAAIGTAVGLGREATALLGTALVLFILVTLKSVDGWIERRRRRHRPVGGAGPSSHDLAPGDGRRSSPPPAGR